MIGMDFYQWFHENTAQATIVLLITSCTVVIGLIIIKYTGYKEKRRCQQEEMFKRQENSYQLKNKKIKFIGRSGMIDVDTKGKLYELRDLLNNIVLNENLQNGKILRLSKELNALITQKYSGNENTRKKKT